MLEKRLTARLLSYWDILRKEQVMPEFAALNFSKIDDIRPYCMVLTLEPGVDADNRDYQVKEMGTKLVTLYGENLTGKNIHKNNSQTKASALLRHAGKIITAPAPLEDDGKFINPQNKVVRYRSCLIPFGNPSTQEVTHVLAGRTWREF